MRNGPILIRHMSREGAEAFTATRPYVVLSITDPNMLVRVKILAAWERVKAVEGKGAQQ